MKRNSNRATAKIRVMLVDDHLVMREALRNVVNSQPDLTVVAQADGGDSALKLLKQVEPDVVLMDGSMPEMNGMEATRRLKKVQPAAKIIGLTLYGDTGYLEEMIAAGVHGYVLKTSGAEKLVEAIRAVAAGGKYFDPAVLRWSTAKAKQPAAIKKLSAEELAVAKRVADGRTNPEIADDLRLTLSAVEKRKTAAMKKLGLRTRAELIRVATSRRW
jgi:DNA-binding NarL/FixJ family response regulator